MSFKTKISIVVVCDFNENMFVCSHMGCTHANTFAPFVYAESAMEFQCFEVKPDDKPSTGMFAVSDDALFALTSYYSSVISCSSVLQLYCHLANSQCHP